MNIVDRVMDVKQKETSIFFLLHDKKFIHQTSFL